MKIDLIRKEFNKLSDFIYFDETQYFREQTNATHIFNDFIMNAEQVIELTTNDHEKYYLYSALGYVNRVINQASQAVYYFNKCLPLVQDCPKQKIATMIRLGESHKYAGLHKKALELFDEAMNLSKIYKVTNYIDFILQHKGKCLLEIGEKSLSKEHLLAALTIRKSNGNKGLVQSTQIILDYLNDSES